MPNGTPVLRTASTARNRCGVIMPPLVSQSATTSAPARAAEREHAGVPQLEVADADKELGIFRVRAGEAAFDEVDAELVELLDDEQLVFERKRDPLHLRAITQRGVVELYRACHGSAS